MLSEALQYRTKAHVLVAAIANAYMYSYIAALFQILPTCTALPGTHVEPYMCRYYSRYRILSTS